VVATELVSFVLSIHLNSKSPRTTLRSTQNAHALHHASIPSYVAFPLVGLQPAEGDVTHPLLRIDTKAVVAVRFIGILWLHFRSTTGCLIVFTLCIYESRCRHNSLIILIISLFRPYVTIMFRVRSKRSHHDMPAQAQRGGRGIALPIRNLGVRKGVVSFL
jgi:hypothetical protein